MDSKTRNKVLALIDDLATARARAKAMMEAADVRLQAELVDTAVRLDDVIGGLALFLEGQNGAAS